MNNSTRKITEGAMMVALVGMMLFLNRQFGGMLEYMMYWILSFPILIYTAKYGLKDGVIPAVAMLLLSLMISAPTTIFYLFSSLVVGLIYGAGVQYKWKNGVLLFWTILCTFISYIITTIVLASIFGYDPGEDMEMVSMLLTFFHVDSGVNIGHLVIMITVLSTILMTVLQSICIHIIANTMMSRMKIACHPMKNIFELSLPKWYAYIIIIIWILFLGRNVIKLNQEILSYLIGMYTIARVIAVAYGAIVLLCLCVVIRRKILVIFVCVGMFIPYIQGIIALTGIFDMLFDIRHKILIQ